MKSLEANQSNLPNNPYLNIETTIFVYNQDVNLETTVFNYS